MTLWRVRATIDDRPGFLAVLAASLALRSVNILSVQVHATPGAAVDEFVVDAPDEMTADELLAAVERGRGRDAWVGPADPYGLIDPPTQMLALAHRLVGDPETLGEVLRELLGDCDIRWLPRGSGTGDGFTPTRISLPDPAGGVLEVTRADPVFTPSEYARAYSMASLAAGLQRAIAPRFLVALPSGAEVVVRAGGLADLPEIVAMHGRCSASSLARRYPAGGLPSARRLAGLLGAPGVTLVAEPAPEGPRRQIVQAPVAGIAPEGPRRQIVQALIASTAPGPAAAEAGASVAAPGLVVATAHLVGEGPDAHLGLLVEDGWQRRGLGRVLLRRAVEAAERAGYGVLHARVPDAAMARLLREVLPEARTADGGGTVSATLRVRTLR